MSRTFLRFFTVLIVVESLTLGGAMLLLDRGVHRWTRQKAQEIAALAPSVASALAAVDLQALRAGGTTSPDYRRCLQVLVDQERLHFPKGGCTFALFDIREGRQGPWLALLAGEAPPYDAAASSTEPDGPASETVRRVAGGEVSFTPVPYGAFGYQYQLSAYAPIRDRSGRVQAALAVDYDVSPLHDLRSVVLTAVAWAVLPAALLSVLVASFLAARFVDPFEFLGQVHARLVTAARNAPPRAVAPPPVDPSGIAPLPLPAIPHATPPADPSGIAPPPIPAIPPAPLSVDPSGIAPPPIPAGPHAPPSTDPSGIAPPPLPAIPPAPPSTDPSGIAPLPLPVTPPAMDPEATHPRGMDPLPIAPPPSPEPPPADPPWESLTVREREVLLYVGQGLTNRQIADHLYVAEDTIRKHLRNIFPKLGVRNRTQAALYAIGKSALDWQPDAPPAGPNAPPAGPGSSPAAPGTPPAGPGAPPSTSGTP